jgi:hypothetical protein
MSMRLVSKDEGMGPYAYVLSYRLPSSLNQGEPMTCVFSHWSDLADWRAKLTANNIETTWDIAVDHQTYHSDHVDHTDA